MSLVDAILSPLATLKVLAHAQDTGGHDVATPDSSITALLDNPAIVRSPGADHAGGSCAYSSPTLVARRGRGNAAETSSGCSGLDQDGFALALDQSGQATADVDSLPPRIGGPATGGQVSGAFIAGHEPSQQKAGSGVRSPVAMPAKTSWLGDSSTNGDDDSKKGRGKLGSPWQLNHVRDTCSDSMRLGLRSLLDAYTRKRQPLGLRLLLVVLLTGFITVMVSYKSLTPSALKQDFVNGSEQEEAESHGAGVLGALTEGFGLQWRGSRGLKSNSNGVGYEGSDWSDGQRTRPRTGGVSMFSLPHGPARAGGSSQQWPSTGTARPFSLFSALGWTSSGTGTAQASEEEQGGIPARILAVPETERELWLPPKSDALQICIQRTKSYKAPAPVATNGYLMVTANGGLNQMRAAICDMVAVARIMNVTLVVPQLDHSSFWADPSNFEDIFQLDHFVNELAKDIRIVKELPESHRDLKPLEIHPVSWSPFKYYKKDLLAKLKKHKVMVFPLTDSRLANNKLPESIQRLRCRANYRALKYTPQIEMVASNLIQRLRSKGPYIALHLRYEKDMLAFTGCTHGLSPEESEELKVMRLNNSRWKEKEIDGEARRTEGLCPLTPGETALFLRAMGFPNTSVIYIAAGDIFGSHGLSDLTTLYPNTFTHNTLATPEELQSLERYQNRMAAVDYTVAVESDVFVYTYEGNMARAVQGHRRFEGHRKTIIPERRAVVKYTDLFSQGLISWGAFRRSIKHEHTDRMGGPHLRLTGLNPKSEENFFANPYPGCICEGPSVS